MVKEIVGCCNLVLLSRGKSLSSVLVLGPQVLVLGPQVLVAQVLVLRTLNPCPQTSSPCPQTTSLVFFTNPKPLGYFNGMQTVLNTLSHTLIQCIEFT